jgi:energy-coupling factor transporter transmembrane protein EcfT
VDMNNWFGIIRRILNRFLHDLNKRVYVRVTIAIAIIVFMTNLDALVDAVIHPNLPYFDKEHLIVGAVTAMVTTVLFGILSIYVANLRRALKEVKNLEGLLPICSSCHKIRSTDNQWNVLEKYITDRTEATFTHSLCPECARELYPEMYGQTHAR